MPSKLVTEVRYLKKLKALAKILNYCQIQYYCQVILGVCKAECEIMSFQSFVSSKCTSTFGEILVVMYLSPLDFLACYFLFLEVIAHYVRKLSQLIRSNCDSDNQWQ